MKRKALVITIGLLIILIFALIEIFFVVGTSQTAIVTTFGKPKCALTQPGLYARWPRPIQKLYVFDNRIRCLEGTFEETYTLDHKNIVIMTYLFWRIKAPVLFLQRVGTISQAEQNLEGLVRNYRNTVIGQHPFSDFVNANPNALKFEQIEQEMLIPVCKEALERYGIEVKTLGINKINLPEAITEKVFERMRAERKGAAETYRSEGESEAIRIRALADREKEDLLTGAEAKAITIKAEGEAKAAQYYRAFNQNPELAVFLKKLTVLEETLRQKTTVVLGTDTMPYDLLQGNDALPEVDSNDD